MSRPGATGGGDHGTGGGKDATTGGVRGSGAARPGSSSGDVAETPPVPDGFTVHHELGRGSSAVVWRATYDVTGQDVALKVWTRPLSDDAARSTFLNECRWHGLLSSHPRVVDWVWASDVDVPHPWTATRPHGESLARWLRQPHTVDERMQVALDLLDGVAAMHRRDLVHRDVNPNNVLVDHTGRAALCDLGIAMPVDRVTGDVAAGTPGFVAPELDEDRDAPSLASDVFASARTLDALLAEDAPLPVVQLVTRAASHRPEDRPADAVEFARRLRETARACGMTVRDAEPVPGEWTEGPSGTESGSRAAHSSHGPADARGRQRRRWVATGMAVGIGVVVSALAAGGWALVRPDSPQPGSQPKAVSDAFSAYPDIAADGAAVRLPPKPSARCETDSITQTRVQDPTGATFGEVRVSDDSEDTVCAKFVKDEGSELFDTRTYLALTLCTETGECDHDWNDFRIDAGPTKVTAPSGCVYWRVSARDADDSTWLVRDVIGTSGCD